MSEKWLTTQEVADLLHLKIQGVRRLIRLGGLPAIFLHDGRTYRIPESELLRWMDAHKIRRQ